METHQKYSIVVAEDDADDRFLIKIAFAEIFPVLDLRFVCNGEELLLFLSDTIKNSSPTLPDLIILDLNMPKMGGHQALMEIKKQSELNAIPIAVLSTSVEENDIEFCKKYGVESFYTKPDNFESLVQIIKSMVRPEVPNRMKTSAASVLLS